MKEPPALGAAVGSQGYHLGSASLPPAPHPSQLPLGLLLLMEGAQEMLHIFPLLWVQHIYTLLWEASEIFTPVINHMTRCGNVIQL